VAVAERRRDAGRVPELARVAAAELEHGARVVVDARRREGHEVRVDVGVAGQAGAGEERGRGDHLGPPLGALREEPPEDAVVPVRVAHHRRDAQVERGCRRDAEERDHLTRTLPEMILKATRPWTSARRANVSPHAGFGQVTWSAVRSLTMRSS